MSINKTSLIVKEVTKDFAKKNLIEIAQLRIKVFYEFPYLYEGSLDYEMHYLERYFNALNGTFILAFDTSLNNKIIGAATCLPLAEEENFVKKPFVDLGYNPNDFFYFGESVLLSEYRGFGLGHLFFNERERVAQKFSQIKFTTFCAVERPQNHSLKPKDYRPLNEFWQKRGYLKQENLQGEFSWQDRLETSETLKKMTYWIKQWN